MILRQMKSEDLKPIIEIIEAHDDDDAIDAQDDFEKNGCNYQWVILENNKIIGTSGFRPILETDNSANISWTYIHKKYCRKGYGSKIFKFVLDQLINVKANKIFIKVSNYQKHYYKLHDELIHSYKSFNQF